MSLAIDVDKVTAVLLAGTWYEVINDSFSIDAYEYLWYSDKDDRSNYNLVHGGGNYGICASGYTFQTEDGWMSGPLDRIISVRHRQ